MTKLLFITLAFISMESLGFAQDAIKRDRETQTELKKLGIQLAAAQKSEDEAEVIRPQYRLCERHLQYRFIGGSVGTGIVTTTTCC